MLVDGFPLWFFETNCWVVAPGPDGPCVVIDAPPDPDAIAARLAHHRLTPVALLTTHGHLDHVGGIGQLVERHPMPVYVHDLDRRHVLDPGPQARMMTRGEFDFPVPPDLRSIDDGDVLELADLRFTAVHTPGHTPGSTCFLLADPSPLEGDLLFSGDHLFAGSVGRTDLPGGSWTDLMRSMREKIMGLPPETRVAPGHGPATTVGRELAVNPFLAEARYA
ncbi:MAG: MBL fold metallo-hydrolase [Actinobacteria bacterium]|nr:MBL fold metallo-hydrolase [Actinomycetota bacterium]